MPTASEALRLGAIVAIFGIVVACLVGDVIELWRGKR